MGHCLSSEARFLDLNNEILQRLHNLKRYNFTELKKATNNFSRQNELGYGFKGFIHSWFQSQAVFVEVIYPEDDPLYLEKKHQLCHPNIMKMIGFCLGDDKSVFVYESVSGSFKVYLCGSGHFQPVTWSVCMKIARDIAKGLAFLHHKTQLIYIEFKISDVLLDSEFNAKLRDFGLVEENFLMEHVSDTRNHAKVLEAINYMPPEIFTPDIMLSAKLNVFGFGMILLEILSGEEAAMQISWRSSSKDETSESVRSFLNAHKNSHVLKPLISDPYLRRDVVKVAQLAFKCVSFIPELRPDMTHVVQVLRTTSLRLRTTS